MKLSEAWVQYEDDKKYEGYSPHTLKGYKLQCDLLMRHFGDVDIGQLTYEKLKEYLRKDVGRLKPSSIAFRLRFIKSIFRWAHEEGYIEKNEAAKLKHPKEGQRVPKALTEEEIEMMRDACETPLERSIFEFLYTTGCRIGEVVKLNRSDIDWVNKSILVNGKGNKEREVFFNVKCEIWLRKYLEERKDDDPALFVTERKPHRMSIAQMRYILKRVARRAGIKKSIYPHTLRHSYAMHLLKNGAPIDIIQSLLGHAKHETTKSFYADYTGEMRKEFYKKYFA